MGSRSPRQRIRSHLLSSPCARLNLASPSLAPKLLAGAEVARSLGATTRADPERLGCIPWMVVAGEPAPRLRRLAPYGLLTGLRRSLEIPAHRTGRADLRHPALRLPQGLASAGSIVLVGQRVGAGDAATDGPVSDHRSHGTDESRIRFISQLSVFYRVLPGRYNIRRHFWYRGFAWSSPAGTQ